jgi:hypothetical protein
MKQSIPVPVGIAIVVIVAILVVALFWHSYIAPPAPRAGSTTSAAPPADMQKSPNPQDLAKQYGYPTPPGQR